MTTSLDPLDPLVTDPERYRVIYENERIRVLEYTDAPGDRTHDHEHPDSFMYSLASFRRRLVHGDTASHAIFVELKEDRPPLGDGRLGPD